MVNARQVSPNKASMAADVKFVICYHGLKLSKLMRTDACQYIILSMKFVEGKFCKC